MSEKVIGDYDAAVSIDGSTNYLLIQPGNASTAYKKINRNVLLGVTGQPADTSSSQSITNKTLDNTNTVTLKDTLFTLQDDGDTTKQAKFQLSGITTATTRTYTLPNASSTLVDLSTAQTLTNKTLTAPVITNGSITGTTITNDAIVGQSSATSGTVYGLAVSSSKISGTSITSGTITTTQIASSTVAASNINFGGAGSGVWWQEIGRTTLSGASDTITVSGMTTKKYLMIIFSVIATGGTVDLPVTFNNDSGNNYAMRTATNGGADVTSTSRANLFLDTTGAFPAYAILNVVNIATQEKLAFSSDCEQNTAGAANAPARRVLVGKWANTANAITRVDINNGGTGDYATGSEIIVLGHD